MAFLIIVVTISVCMGSMCKGNIVTCNLKLYTHNTLISTWREREGISRMHCFTMCVRDLQCMFVKIYRNNCWTSSVVDGSNTTIVDEVAEVGRTYRVDQGDKATGGFPVLVGQASESAKSVSIPRNKPISARTTQAGYAGKKGHAELCEKSTVLKTVHNTAHESSSHKEPSEVDAFVQTEYVVVTQTAQDESADTDDDVFLALIGEAATYKLFLNNPGNEMAAGQNDTFRFTSRCTIGNITKMQLIMVSFLPMNDWFCIGIDLRRELKYTRHSEVEVFYSNVSRWLRPASLFDIVGRVDEIAYTRLETYRKDF